MAHHLFSIGVRVLLNRLGRGVASADAEGAVIEKIGLTVVTRMFRASKL